MRILQVVHDFLPKHRAGAEIYTYNVSRLLARDHDVHIFYTQHEPARRQYSVARGEYEGLPFTRVINNHCQRRFEETYNNPRMDAIFEKLLDDFRPDMVHFQHLMYHSANYVAIAKRRGIPTVATLHDFWPLCEQEGKRIRLYVFKGDHDILCENIDATVCAKCISHRPTMATNGVRVAYAILRAIRTVIRWDPSGLVKRVMGAFSGSHESGPLIIPVTIDEVRRRNEYLREAYSQIDHIFSPSPFLKSEFDRHGYPREKNFFSDYGFDMRPFADFKRKPGKGLRFGFVGTLAELKGVHVLIDAFNAIYDPTATLHIFGATETFPKYTQALRDAVKRDGVHFHGRFDPAQVAEVFAQFDVLVVPSIWYENSPLVIHEAFMSRTPVITTGMGGMADLVRDGEWGLLFRCGDAEDLADKMRSLVEDTALVKKLASSVPPVKTIEQDVADIAAVYSSLLSRADA